MNEKQMLEYALNEINTLRQRNELMAARLDMFDTMMRMFHTVPNFGNEGLMARDIAWEIKNYLEEKKTL